MQTFREEALQRGKKYEQAIWPEEIMKRFWKDLTGHYHYALYAAKSELKSEVANSYLNWIWWVLEPFCFMLIYTFIFGVIFNSREPFFSAFVFIGLTAWDFFNRCLTQSVKIMRNNKSIVTKVYIPKFILLISKMFFNGYKMMISFVIIVGMVIFFKIPLTWNILYIIPIMSTLFALTFACMTHLLHYGVFVQDLTNVVTIVLRMIFYMTGIFYNIETKLPEHYVGLLMKGNPMALILNSLRKCILYGQAPDMKWITIWFVVSIIVAALGIRKIYKNENSYVKVI